MEICKHYKHKKKCNFNGNCAEQLATDKKVCCSNLYYAMGLEKEIEHLKKLNAKRKKAMKRLSEEIDLRKHENQTLELKMIQIKAQYLLKKGVQ